MKCVFFVVCSGGEWALYLSCAGVLLHVGTININEYLVCTSLLSDQVVLLLCRWVVVVVLTFTAVI